MTAIQVRLREPEAADWSRDGMADAVPAGSARRTPSVRPLERGGGTQGRPGQTRLRVVDPGLDSGAGLPL